MPEMITIARPYAKAAFEFADQHNVIEQWKKTVDLLAEVSCDKKIIDLISSNMGSEKLAEMFINIIGKNELDQYSSNFIKLLAYKKRLNLLPYISIIFNKYYLQKQSIAEIDVISAKPLSDNQLKEIAIAMEKRLSQKIKLHNQLDPSIICGFIIRVGDMVIDSSIKGRLKHLADALQS